MSTPLPDWLVPTWETVLNKWKKDKSRPVGDIHKEVFSSNLYPLQRANELSRMIGIIRDRVPEPKALLEVGVDKCGTLFHWLTAFPSLTKAVGIEFRGTPAGQLFEEAFPDVEFLWIPGSSYAPANVDKVRNFLKNDRLDVVFLDGDKSNFLTDFDMYEPLVSRRGIVMMHDVFDDDSPMQKAFYKAAERYTDYGVLIDTSECDAEKSRLMAARIAGAEDVSGHAQWVRAWMHTSCGFGFIMAGSRK